MGGPGCPEMRLGCPRLCSDGPTRRERAPGAAGQLRFVLGRSSERQRRYAAAFGGGVEIQGGGARRFTVCSTGRPLVPVPVPVGGRSGEDLVETSRSPDLRQVLRSPWVYLVLRGVHSSP